MQFRRRTRALLAASLLAITTGTVLGVTGVAVAGAESLDPVDEPQALPASCPDGIGALVDVKFDNGDDQEANDLAQLSLEAGDTLTMSWSAASDGCAAVVDGQPIAAVTLAVYGGVTKDHFDPEDHQYLLGANSCGARGSGAQQLCGTDGDRYTLSLVIPSRQDCYAQIDGVVGAPLKNIGPDGSYYNHLLRNEEEGPDLIIEAWVNSSHEDEPGRYVKATSIIGTKFCAPPTTEPPTTTTEAPTTTTTAPVLPPTAEPPPVTSAPVEVEPEVAVAGVTVSRELPETGAQTGVLVLVGASLIVLGAAALLAVRAQARGVTTS